MNNPNQWQGFDSDTKPVFRMTSHTASSSNNDYDYSAPANTTQNTFGGKFAETHQGFGGMIDRTAGGNGYSNNAIEGIKAEFDYDNNVARFAPNNDMSPGFNFAMNMKENDFSDTFTSTDKDNNYGNSFSGTTTENDASNPEDSFQPPTDVQPLNELSESGCDSPPIMTERYEPISSKSVKGNKQSSKKQRERNANFAPEEVEIILKLYAENKKVIEGKGLLNMQQRKREVFQRMADEINKTTDHLQTPRRSDQIRNKLKNMKDEAARWKLAKLQGSKVAQGKFCVKPSVLDRLVKVLDGGAFTPGESEDPDEEKSPSKGQTGKTRRKVNVQPNYFEEEEIDEEPIEELPPPESTLSQQETKRITVRHRTKNFSPQETEVILDIWEAHREVLNDGNRENTAKRKAVFNTIAVKLKALAGKWRPVRTVDQIASRVWKWKTEAGWLARLKRGESIGRTLSTDKAILERVMKIVGLEATEGDDNENYPVWFNDSDEASEPKPSPVQTKKNVSSLVQNYLKLLVESCKELKKLGVDTGAMVFEDNSLMWCGSPRLQRITTHPHFARPFTDSSSKQKDDSPPKEDWTVMAYHPSQSQTSNQNTSQGGNSQPASTDTVGFKQDDGQGLNSLPEGLNSLHNAVSGLNALSGCGDGLSSLQNAALGLNALADSGEDLSSLQSAASGLVSMSTSGEGLNASLNTPNPSLNAPSGFNPLQSAPPGLSSLPALAKSLNAMSSSDFNSSKSGGSRRGSKGQNSSQADSGPKKGQSSLSETSQESGNKSRLRNRNTLDSSALKTSTDDLFNDIREETDIDDFKPVAPTLSLTSGAEFSDDDDVMEDEDTPREASLIKDALSALDGTFVACSGDDENPTEKEWPAKSKSKDKILKSEGSDNPSSTASSAVTAVNNALSDALSSLSSPAYTCEVCQETFTHLTSFTLHRQQHKPGDEEEKKPKVTRTRTRRKNTPITRRNMYLGNKNDGILTNVIPIDPKMTSSNPEDHMTVKEEIESSTPFVNRFGRLDSRVRRFVCKFCGKRFLEAKSCRDHIYCHTGQKPYHCDECGRDFAQYNSLHYHQLAQHRKDHLCTACDTRFTSYRLLLQHRKTMHRSLRPKVSQHVIQAPSEDVYKCKTCNKVFPGIKQRKAHEWTHLGLKLHKCDICNKTLSSRANMERHRERHKGLRKYQCELCGFKFTEKSNMHSHMRSHRGEKPHKCEYCGKAFVVSSALIVHRRQHTGERPYLCDICGKGFTQGSKLNIHRRQHTGEKAYRCEDCGERFQHTHQLKVHRRKHTGVHPFTCSICGKHFQKTKHLTIHFRLHTGEKPFTCNICGDKFHRSDALFLHKKKHNPKPDLPPPAPKPQQHPNPPNLSANLPTNLSANLSANLPTNLSANLPTNLSANLPTNLSANLSTNLSTLPMPVNLARNPYVAYNMWP